MWESPRPVYPNELYHYGVKGMHWGIRHYQPYPKGYNGKGRYLGKIQGGSKVDKMTAEEKKRIKRRNRLILAGAGILAGGTAYAIGRKMLKKGNPDREALARKRLSETLDDAQWYREDAINDPNSILAPFHRRRARLKEHQADRYEKLANKYIDARINGKMIKNAGRNLLLSSAGGVIAREVLDTRNEKKKKRKKKR